MPALTGKTTEGSISSGVIHGVVAEFDGVIERYKSRYPALQILVTGGDASVFETHSKNVIFAAPNLVLTGLNQILEHNVS